MRENKKILMIQSQEKCEKAHFRLISVNNGKKTNDPTWRNLMTDKQMDKGQFIGPFSPVPARSNKANCYE